MGIFICQSETFTSYGVHVKIRVHKCVPNIVKHEQPVYSYLGIPPPPIVQIFAYSGLLFCCQKLEHLNQVDKFHQSHGAICCNWSCLLATELHWLRRSTVVLCDRSALLVGENPRRTVVLDKDALVQLVSVRTFCVQSFLNFSIQAIQNLYEV